MKKDEVFYLLERGQDEGVSPPLWWAGGDTWVSDVNQVPKEYRFKTIYEAQAAIIIEREDRGGRWPWACRITNHSFIKNDPEAPGIAGTEVNR